MLPHLRPHGSILVSWRWGSSLQGRGSWGSMVLSCLTKRRQKGPSLTETGGPAHTHLDGQENHKKAHSASKPLCHLAVCVCVWGYDTHPHQRGLNVKSQRVKAYLSQSGRYTQPPTQAAIHLHVQTKQTLNHQRTHAQAHNHPHTHTDTNAAGNLGAGLL